MNKNLVTRIAMPLSALALAFIPGCVPPEEKDMGYDLPELEKKPEKIIQREKTWYEAVVKNHEVFERKEGKFACIYDSTKTYPPVHIALKSDKVTPAAEIELLKDPVLKNVKKSFEENQNMALLERFEFVSEPRGPLSEPIYFAHSHQKTSLFKPGERVTVFAYGNRTIAHVLPTNQGE